MCFWERGLCGESPELASDLYMGWDGLCVRCLWTTTLARDNPNKLAGECACWRDLTEHPLGRREATGCGRGSPPLWAARLAADAQLRLQLGLKSLKKSRG